MREREEREKEEKEEKVKKGYRKARGWYGIWALKKHRIDRPREKPKGIGEKFTRLASLTGGVGREKEGVRERWLDGNMLYHNFSLHVDENLVCFFYLYFSDLFRRFLDCLI